MRNIANIVAIEISLISSFFLYQKFVWETKSSTIKVARLEKCNPKYQKIPGESSGNWNDFTCLWGGNNYKYTISLAPQIGYKVEKTYFVRKWLPWRKENLYVLRQNPNV